MSVLSTPGTLTFLDLASWYMKSHDTVSSQRGEEDISRTQIKKIIEQDIGAQVRNVYLQGYVIRQVLGILVSCICKSIERYKILQGQLIFK